MNYSKMRKKLNKADNILILMHSDPDIDALGAAYGLCKYLISKNKFVKIAIEENFSERYSFFLPKEEIKKRFVLKDELNEKDFKTLVCVDTSDPKLLGSFKYLLGKIKESYVIDHHNTFFAYAKYNLNDSSKSSTSEMIYDLLDGKVKDFESAEAIYAGIVFDTGNFRFSNTSPELFVKISKLLKKFTIDTEKIYFNIFENESIERKKLKALIVNTIETYENGEMVTSFLLQDFLGQLKLSRSDTEGMVKVGHSLKGCLFSVFVKEKERNISMSFRCRNDFDVSKLAARWGGGGHKKASGLKLKNCSLEEVKQEILPECVKEYNKWRLKNEK